jgi:hypothetical protein
MCGRYTAAKDFNELIKLVGVIMTRAPFLAPRYNIAPTQLAPVIYMERHQPAMKLMRWGLIGEGNFGIVYSCRDEWKNELAVKVLKPLHTYEKVKASAEAEILKLLHLRHPNITYVYDAFEYRDTFYIVTERCFCPVADLFSTIKDFDGPIWLMPIARCLLQALHYPRL